MDSENKLSSEEVQLKVIDLRNKHSLPQKGIAASNIRRQLKRLRDLFLVEKVKNQYRITENEELIHIFEQRIEKYYLNSIVSRVKDYFKALEQTK